MGHVTSIDMPLNDADKCDAIDLTLFRAKRYLAHFLIRICECITRDKQRFLFFPMEFFDRCVMRKITDLNICNQQILVLSRSFQTSFSRIFPQYSPEQIDDKDK